MSRNGTDGMMGPEVIAMPERRQFTAAEKLRILDEVDACTEPGEIGALLRREGIYSSYLSKWREARDMGRLSEGSDPRRGPKTSSDTALQRELARLQRENEQLRSRLEQAEAIIDVQKKISQLLGPSAEKSEKEDR